MNVPGVRRRGAAAAIFVFAGLVAEGELPTASFGEPPARFFGRRGGAVQDRTSGTAADWLWSSGDGRGSGGARPTLQRARAHRSRCGRSARTACRRRLRWFGRRPDIVLMAGAEIPSKSRSRDRPAHRTRESGGRCRRTTSSAFHGTRPRAKALGSPFVPEVFIKMLDARAIQEDF
jgi:hypothetical protein